MVLTSADRNRAGLVLEGLPGDNPLGFLAALGTLRALSGTWPERGLQMTWIVRGGWRPTVSAVAPIERGELIEALDAALRGRHRAPEFTLVKDETGDPREIKLPPSAFADVARAAVKLLIERGDRTWADFCAAYGTDAYVEEPLIRETDLHFTSGQQSFMGTLRALAGDPPPPPTTTPGKRKSGLAREDQGATTAGLLPKNWST
jgi:hypothetical protein